MSTKYTSVLITPAQAENIVFQLYGYKGKAIALGGDVDFNFRIDLNHGPFVLKVSRPGDDRVFLEFQQEVLEYLKNHADILTPKVQRDKSGSTLSTWVDTQNRPRYVRMLSWIEGTLWSAVNPRNRALLIDLGNHAAQVTAALEHFEHPTLSREFEWDLAQAAWTSEYLELLDSEQQIIATGFIQDFLAFQDDYRNLRKGPVHNDVNDNNIIVANKFEPHVKGLIDYGDAISTQIINDVAIVVAYGAMRSANPLESAAHIIEGYHQGFPLTDKELAFLHTLVGMRLIVSVTKSAIGRKREPENKYLVLTEKPAWDLLEKWFAIDPHLAHYSFRQACGKSPHPGEIGFVNWASEQVISTTELFPTLARSSVQNIDLDIASPWLGHESEFQNAQLLAKKFEELMSDEQITYAGGYLEIRPLYDTMNYVREGNQGTEYRTMHLGIDFWVHDLTPVHSILDGTVYSIHDNQGAKNYGPTLIIEHTYSEGHFYSLYGHLSRSSLDILSPGQSVKKNDLIAYIGNPDENGGWPSHLHFQLIMDVMEAGRDFQGVAYPTEKEVWSSLCPDPNLLFKIDSLKPASQKDIDELLKLRRQHMGKGMSISYKEPLKIVRGSGAFLIDHHGKRYLDTVNNVAHVGHEHIRVVSAAKKQNAVLNTNTRYLHDNVLEFARELLSTFPKELSVVHFVNSGSEANELALRMARIATGEKNIIALEMGYHGNTSACMDVSSYKFDGEGGAGANEHCHVVPLPDTYRGLFTGPEAGRSYADYIGQSIKEIQENNNNIAGFICESIISCGGQIELPDGYLSRAYDLVRQAGGVCIADEVQVGCGRVGSHFWGFELHQVVPDIVTIGKPIGNGHPLAAVVCTQEIANSFDNGMEFFNTFGGNPVSSAIGLEVLKVIKDEKLQENALHVGAYLIEELKKLQNLYPIIGNVRGRGLFLGFELVDQEKNPLSKEASYLANRMKELGVLMSTDGKDQNVLKIKPPMVFSKDNADQLINTLDVVFREYAMFP